MRIHRLDIEAFGPFAAPQHIDFDHLSAQGLFLLNGATGAGKTSILDAICFALYGSVPGTRQEGKRLRSDHAAPGAEPRVVCEFSARGRRFEVTRSPAWDRPSARGRHGFTTQQAKTLLRERVAGSWEEKSSRNDEVGAELSDILGMDREQFTRVVMLPQGDFAAFLRSKANERLDLLQKLFGTQRFETVERQLLQQSAEATRAVQENTSELKLLLDRVASERDAVDLHTADTSADATPAARTEPGQDPEAWLAAVEAEVRAEGKRREDEAAEAASLSTRLLEEFQEAQERSLRHGRLGAAMQRRVLLELAAPRALENKEMLGKHWRAAVLSGQLEAVDSAARKLQTAIARASVIRGKLEAVGLDAATADVALETVKAGCAVLEARLSDEQRLEVITARLATVNGEVAEHQAAAQASAAVLEQLRLDVSTVESEILPHVPVADQLAELERAAADADELVGIVALHATATHELDEITRRHLQARTSSQDLRQKWLDVRELRLANAAGELAAALESGKPCAVCGSEEHPNPAEAVQTALSLAQEEEDTKERFEASEKVLGLLAEQVSSAAQVLAGLVARGGSVDAAEAESKRASARDAASAARQAAVELEKLRARHGALSKQIALVQQEHAESVSAAAQASSAVHLLQEQCAALEAELAGLREGFPSLRGKLEALMAERGLLQAAVDADRELDQAKQAGVDAAASLEKALSESGFASGDEARREILPPADVVGLEKDLADFDAESSRVDELFAAEDLVLAAKEASIGELPLTEAELAESRLLASTAADDARAKALSAGLAGKSADAVARLGKEYRTLAQEGREPLSRAHMLAELADTVRGSGDNNYRMSLNTYVLAARLEQVALAASERLVAMSDGRYTLQHTDAKAARGAKSGLGLEVVDEWTGQRRDTSTLSGGESFMASLSLALGLADVVQQEAGGVDIETLFVDEGFGSLDEQSLEQVMDALEGLRDGGRVVGLVSHVAEMKQRITSQLQVVKGRNGSSVRIAEALPV
ncbi:chromosome segregation protein SMC [Arthrobacter sp. MYb23]|uniref:AAA family ATPase n=1 Tax=unclassified Arthrobacter TaxID=235627 RepID=UPI000CFAD9A6|nr:MULTISPECIES: SMC family ATPase [unclassified Arthrobacter]PRB44201.1 chromosome segregation protein SMC [Arthrobacter sp. MYb51]PRB98453.1 chromosome segregation protein SMC [Arthrobacter sp. MYb23]